MSQDLKRDREIGKGSENDLVHAVHNAIYPHLFNINVHYSSWTIARAAVAAIPEDAASERWKDIAYNENERAGEAAKKYLEEYQRAEGLRAENAKLSAKLEARPDAYDRRDRATVAACADLLHDIEKAAERDEAKAQDPEGCSNARSVRDSLESRLAAAERARHSRALAARLAEALGIEESMVDEEYPKYWGHKADDCDLVYKVQARGCAPLCAEKDDSWRASWFFDSEEELDEDHELRRIAAADLPEGV